MSVRAIRSFVAAAALAAALTAGAARATEPASTAFTYQGQLTQAGAPAEGIHEFECRLYDAPAGGNLVASLPDPCHAEVANGLFTLRLDFGEAAFRGVQLWLELAVRPESDPQGAFTILSPRQELSPAPYASMALNSPFLRNGSGLYYEGRMALGSDQPPVGILDVVGPPHDATVVLPNNSISSAECLDEAGVSGAFSAGQITFTSAPITLTTASIQCPGPGFVLAFGSTDLSSVAYEAAGGYVGIESTAEPAPYAPADASWTIFGDDMPSIYHSCPVSVHKVFPVTAGTRTFYLRGWLGFGSNSPKGSRAKLTLLFIPSAYGSLPQ